MSRVDTDALARYEQTRDSAIASLLALEGLVGHDRRRDLTAARTRLERGRFVLAVVGEFSSGKSFLLNALLGKFRRERVGTRDALVGLLAVDINPSTATITQLVSASTDRATAIYEDGREEQIPLDRLNRFIAVGDADAHGIHDATKAEGSAPTRVVVETNSEFLARGFVVADTPGLASINPAHRRATLGFLPSADAVLYVIDSQQPFSEGDAAFLGIIRKHIDSIFIVQTKIDLWMEKQGDGRPAWESAFDRIASLAAIHAPGTYVYALSAREYAEGILDNDARRIDESRFPQFLSALDASLVAKTGRARLRRILNLGNEAAEETQRFIASELTMLSLPTAALTERRSAVLPELDAIDDELRAARNDVRERATIRRTIIEEQGHALCDDVETALLRAFDAADVARLRDRARLHMLVDRTLAATVDDFAAAVAEPSIAELTGLGQHAVGHFDIHFSLAESLATAFGSDPATSLWSGDLADAVKATVVLESLGGPAVGFVHDIASRFAAKSAQAYMKRELGADLRAEIFPRLRADIVAFVHTVAATFAHTYDDLQSRLAAAGPEIRDARIGAIDRALKAHSDDSIAITKDALRVRSSAISKATHRLQTDLDEFLARDEEIAAADASSDMLARARLEPTFDTTNYGKALQPTRWRVAVLGGLRRGKSSLIDALANLYVLPDDSVGSARYPIHVRYGERDEAFTLDAHGNWQPIALDTIMSAAANDPILRLVPWKFPRELVLVHAPAFDSGDPIAENASLAVAAASSHALCLFSRQLSDRELDLYERIAELGKPMLFVHTFADNETPSERRDVVALAASYLRERKIPTERIFTISAREYFEAVHAQRAPAPWNELLALRSTLEGQAESHMARLARLARAAQVSEPLKAPTKSTGFLTRLFGAGR